MDGVFLPASTDAAMLASGRADATPLSLVHLKNRDPEKEEWARAFDDFLGSEKATDILHKFGYDTEMSE